jgi:murein DD-endopeptidase MepM/ murein hydrolase activator NlpD
MKIYRCTKQNIISQTFGPKGTKPEMIEAYRKIGLEFGHNGIDFACPRGERVLWDGYDIEGKVIQLSTEPNEGLGVVVLTEDKDGIFTHRFWHLLEIRCRVGQILHSGNLIGLADSTGFSTGHHVHRDLKELDKDYKVKNPNNGYHGCIDPWPYFTNIYIGDVLDMLGKMLENMWRILEKMRISLLK